MYTEYYTVADMPNTYADIREGVLFNNTNGAQFLLPETQRLSGIYATYDSTNPLTALMLYNIREDAWFAVTSSFVSS